MDRLNEEQKKVYRILPMIPKKLDPKVVQELVDLGMAMVEDGVVYPLRKAA